MPYCFSFDRQVSNSFFSKHVDKPKLFVYNKLEIRKLIGAGRKIWVHRGAGNFPAILIYRFTEDWEYTLLLDRVLSVFIDVKGTVLNVSKLSLSGRRAGKLRRWTAGKTRAGSMKTRNGAKKGMLTQAVGHFARSPVAYEDRKRIICS